MKPKHITLLAAMLACATRFGFAAEISLESAPPVVVKTVPAAGATDVDPALAEIRATFSKAMQDGGWSWSTWGEENYPETTGAPKYLADNRTCVLPVKLQPGKFYAIWLNSDNYKNFKDTAGQPAVPYLLTFFTGDARSGQAGASDITAEQGIGKVIADKIRAEVTRKLKDAGASVDELRVSVAEARDRATPFKVNYRGLHLFKGSDGKAVKQTDGEFRMEYIGRGQWQGALAGVTFTAQVGAVDQTDLPFVNDPHVIGTWESVDFVETPSKFDPDKRSARGELFFKGIVFEENGKCRQPWLTWTKGFVMHSGDKTASRYEIRELKGQPYLFFEWRSGDVTILGRKPHYYVLKQQDAGGAAAVRREATFGDVSETVLTKPQRRVAQLLDLDSGKRATTEVFGQNDRETHTWIRDHGLDAMGVVEHGGFAVMLFDAVIAAAPSNSFNSLTPQQILTNWHLGQGEANKIVTASLAEDKTDTFFFRTRENGWGAMQLLGQSEEPAGVKVRYRIVSSGTAKSEAGGDSSPAGKTASADFLRLLNGDQRAVMAWTDRQFKSFFDGRTFDGWSEEERATLEKKLIDALDGPRSTEYYQAINSLAALRSVNALSKLRALASERVDRNNRDRWMAIRALGIIGDREAVPELIHLVYHGNVNTHWWAQISLVRITGKNFAKDWNAWGKWWNEQGGQPPYKSEIVRWWNGQAEPDKLAASLEESDQKFLTTLNPK